MLLTITTTHRPATDLGYLLHKNPARVQTFAQNFGKAHVFYPQADAERCTAALLLDVDPIGLVRGRGKGRGGLLTDYVNDRPYVASSFMSVTIARVYGSALGGRSKERPELVDVPLPLTATVAALPCRGGEEVLRRLFEPLGYAVSLHCADDHAPSGYRNLRLEARKPLAELLAHLYVLISVLDDDKHYWVGDDEVDKLVQHGGSWLGTHPERELIAKRYLKYQPSLTDLAIARLAEGEQDDDAGPAPAAAAGANGTEDDLERPARLQEARMATVVHALQDCGARRVVDLGCGEGRLIRELVPHYQFREIVGLDASPARLEAAARRLKIEGEGKARDRVRLLQGALTYRDRRIRGFDAAAAVEVIEHLDPGRLSAFERAVFQFARPKTMVVTTPNVEYNVKFPGLPAGSLRHRDHRFEWTRAEFAAWGERIASAHGYEVAFHGIGEAEPDLGAPTQMAVFQQCA